MKKILLILITLTSFIPIITKRNDYIDVTKVIYINSICLDINEDNNMIAISMYLIILTLHKLKYLQIMLITLPMLRKSLHQL